MADRHRAQFLTRTFAMGSFVFAVETTTAADQELIEAVFADVPEPPSSPRRFTRLSATQDADRSTWTVNGPGLDDVSVPTMQSALDLLVGDVNYCALDAEPDHLHLHAALAIRDGRAAILAGQRGTGKSTTVAHLLMRGWSFVTDEAVRLPSTGLDVSGFPKPLSVKPGGDEHVDRFAPWMLPRDPADPHGFRFVPVGTAGVDVVKGGRAHLIVKLRRTIDDPGVSARKLHPADAVVTLMQETLDAERYAATASRLAHLAAATNCYELTMGTPEETADEVERLFALDPAEPVAVEEHPSSTAFRRGVVTLSIDDRVVIHDTMSGRIVALDAGGARVWKHLAGWSRDGEIDIDGPVVGPFVAQLRALGLLAGAA